jgi:hypothetical protein
MRTVNGRSAPSLAACQDALLAWLPRLRGPTTLARHRAQESEWRPERSRKFDYAGCFRRVRELEGLVLSPDKVAWQETYTPPERSVDALLYLGCNVLITGHLAVEVVSVLKVRDAQ